MSGYTEYLKELGKLRASRRNELAYMASCRVPIDEAGLKLPIEREYYDRLIQQSNEHYNKYGFYPTYEMEEIEYDDPCLDIYRDPVE